jgi:hypothetical protein
MHAKVFGGLSGGVMKAHRTIGGGTDKLVDQGVTALAHLIRRALRSDAAIGQHNHLISNRKGFVQIV